MESIMKNTLRRSVVCLVLVFSVAILADAANKSRIGTAGAQELLVPVGARGIAIGGSSMVFATGVEAMYYNPAGLGRMAGGVEALVSQMSYFADINVVYGGLGIRAGDFGTIGVSLKSIGFGDIPVTTTLFPDGTGENYSPTYLTVGLSYGKAVTDRIAVGITANIISERILSLSSTGMSFDLGIQYQNLGVQGLNLGVAVKNIGSPMQFTGSNLLVAASVAGTSRGPQTYAVEAASADLPSNLEIGLSYSRKFDEKNSILVGGMFRNNNYQDDEYNLGTEYSFNNLFFVRGGYTFAPQADKDVTGARGYMFDYTLGAGVHYALGDLDLSFDYAYRHMKYFDGNNVISVRVGF
jgi:hypothetical protein